jgi:hypothetical protein
MQQHLSLALDAELESESVDFKSSFDPASASEWLEIIKDIVALANTGGGCILFGVGNDGGCSGVDLSAVFEIDPADVTNKIYKYTDQQFHGFEMKRSQRHGCAVAAFLIPPSVIPIVFSKVGSYAIEGGKQKTAFAAGTVYFRHGAKSEPGNSEDLRQFVERRLEEIRKSWLTGIAKVVEAPAGSEVQIVAAGESLEGKGVRLVNDPTAPTFYRMPIDSTHPFRQKEVVEEVNKRLKGVKTIKAFQIQCIRRAHKIEENATFCYKQKFASARYSGAFVDWILEQYASDSLFFETAKAKMDEMKVAEKD